MATNLPYIRKGGGCRATSLVPRALPNVSRQLKFIRFNDPLIVSGLLLLLSLTIETTEALGLYNRYGINERLYYTTEIVLGNSLPPNVTKSSDEEDSAGGGADGDVSKCVANASLAFSLKSASAALAFDPKTV